ncbi:hypothetical protein EIP91_002312 [Steccherinum ochraceum]|uniref:Uncharacterized protein n=1 Tax=Steccherinum ochraceum TaxID=92696 RepID=A0A4R0RIN8_9APHY|nr:hypothetical protein EIP91_002312 [Steccherinum ochraceum]
MRPAIQDPTTPFPPLGILCFTIYVLLHLPLFIFLQYQLPDIALHTGVHATFTTLMMAVAIFVLAIPSLVDEEFPNLRQILTAYATFTSYTLCVWLLEIAYLSIRDLGCPFADILIGNSSRPASCPDAPPPARTFTESQSWQHLLIATIILLFPPLAYHIYAKHLKTNLITPLRGLRSFVLAIIYCIYCAVMVAIGILMIPVLLATLLVESLVVLFGFLKSATSEEKKKKDQEEEKSNFPLTYLALTFYGRFLWRTQDTPKPRATTPPETLTSSASAGEAILLEERDGMGLTGHGGTTGGGGERQGGLGNPGANDKAESKTDISTLQLLDADHPYSFV